MKTRAAWAAVVVGSWAGAFVVLAAVKLLFAYLLGDAPGDWYTPDQLAVHVAVSLLTGTIWIYNHRCRVVNKYERCRHCGQPIHGGRSEWLHADGLRRCDPVKTGQPYGLNAEPERLT